MEMTYPELLLWAARNNETADIELCFEEKVDVNTLDKDSGNTPLHYACANGFLFAAKLLLNHGADPNIKNQSGNTSLHWAVLGRDKEIVNLLIERKADANIRNEAELLAFEEALNSG